jgi:hypothetical protein
LAGLLHRDGEFHGLIVDAETPEAAQKAVDEFPRDKASLEKETTDVWKWYLEFFKEVIRLDSAEDPTPSQRNPSQPRHGYSEYCLPVQLSYAQEGTNAKVNITRGKTTYTFSAPMPMPSGWFKFGMRPKVQESPNFRLSFLVKVYRKSEDMEPMSFESCKTSRDLHITIGVKVYVGRVGRLNPSHAQFVLPRVKGSIVHELRHLWNERYFPMTHDINKPERKYTSGRSPAYYNFKDWLLYFGETREMSPRVDQIASYACDKRLTVTEAFKAIINYKIETKGKAARKKRETFEGSMEELVRELIRKQVDAFNKRYPRNQIALEEVLPDKSWFAKCGSSLFYVGNLK